MICNKISAPPLPDSQAAFDAFSGLVLADGALPANTKQLIPVAVVHLTRCPYCITGNTRATIGTATWSMPQELMETIWAAAETPAGGTCGYLAISPPAMERV